MIVELMSLPDLEALDGSHARNRPVLDGALPPDCVISGAIEALRSGADPRWCSFYLFVDMGDGAVVGTGGFKGEPHLGEVEIGYGVAPARRGSGFATAAVGALIRIACTADSVTTVVAETARDNVASRRVLEKVGFVRRGERDDAEDGLLDLWQFALTSGSR